MKRTYCDNTRRLRWCWMIWRAGKWDTTSEIDYNLRRDTEREWRKNQSRNHCQSKRIWPRWMTTHLRPSRKMPMPAWRCVPWWSAVALIEQRRWSWECWQWSLWRRKKRRANCHMILVQKQNHTIPSYRCHPTYDWNCEVIVIMGCCVCRWAIASRCAIVRHRHPKTSV